MKQAARKANGYGTHPAADVFPMIEGAEFAALVADIRAKGLLTPIVLLGDLILDGRNRYRACIEAGVEPRFVQHEGDDPIGFVVSQNLARRHLNETQRAMVGERIANLGEGRPSETSPIGGVSQPAAAALLNVSVQSITRARKVREDAIPEVVKACERGEMAASAAALVAELPPETQREVIERAKAEGSMRRVRAMVREVGGDAPIYPTTTPVAAPKPPSEPAPAAEPKLTPRQKASRDVDEKIAELIEAGETQREIAETLGCSPSTVSHAMLRLGLRRKPHPIDTITRRAQGDAEDFEAFMLNPGMYRDGADTERREECVTQLRRLRATTKKLINWLNKEATGG